MSKKYEVRFSKSAQTKLKAIDKNDARIIMSWISKKLVNSEDPYAHGKSLKGDSKEMWRYKLGNYRLISNIDDKNRD